MSHVIEWLSEFTNGQLHFILRLSLKDHDPVLDPLFLLLSQHKILPNQLFLSIVLSDDHADKQIHEEKVSHDDDQYEKYCCYRVFDLVVRLLVC